jgi:hypothetical protein
MDTEMDTEVLSLIKPKEEEEEKQVLNEVKNEEIRVNILKDNTQPTFSFSTKISYILNKILYFTSCSSKNQPN